MKRVVVAALLAMTMGGEALAHQGAGFGYRGEGATLEFDPQKLPPRLLPGYNLLKENCTRCHTQERIVRHLQDNISKGADYEANLKALIMKKLRMSGMAKADGKAIMDFLWTLYQIEMGEHAKLPKP